jgi:hypothetical protein
VLTAEGVLVAAIAREFYNVGNALGNYMICDWLLWIWREGQIDWFASYKEDSVHDAAIKSGKLPSEASDFVAFCRGIRIPDGYGRASGKLCPPRVLNECIWLDGNRSS